MREEGPRSPTTLQAKAKSMKQRLERQLAIIKKRCESLTTKGCEISSGNAQVRLSIDNLRLEKLAHQEHVNRMTAKAEKMDQDIAFLTHQAHQALDQREKVRGKFLMAQRDMMQGEAKLAVIGSLCSAPALDMTGWMHGVHRRRGRVDETADVGVGPSDARPTRWQRSATGSSLPRHEVGVELAASIIHLHGDTLRPRPATDC